MKNHNIINLADVDFDKLMKKIKKHKKLSSKSLRNISKSKSKIPFKKNMVVHKVKCPNCYSQSKSIKKCTNCGCKYSKKMNNSKKMVAIYKRPSNGKIVGKILSRNQKKKHTKIHKNSTRKSVRNIINRILSKKSHTRRNSLASMIEKIHTNEINQNMKMKNNTVNTHNKSKTMKSKVVQSYYKSFNNGSKKVERGRRIVDNSENPFIMVDMLNNGLVKSVKMQR